MIAILSKVKKFLIKSKKSERKSKLKELNNYARNSYCFHFSKEDLDSFMELANGDSQNARELIDEYHDAKYRYLVPATSEKQDLILNGGGVENHKGTSCYVDSLLYAMFFSLSGFEQVLTCKTEHVELQESILSFVNTLRKGGLVKVPTVSGVRELLKSANWRGTETQEDAHEFFTFLTETFKQPCLSFLNNFYHTAKQDFNDVCITKDRFVSLNIPEKGRPELEKLLKDYFCSDLVMGLVREVSNGVEKRVNALRTSKLLPFYCGASDTEDVVLSQYDSFPMIVPIVLKRYQMSPGYSTTKKNKAKVKLSPQFSFDKYVSLELDENKCPQCNSKMEFTMVLKSAVCHKGEYAQSGHYIAYSKSTTRDHWYRLDDLAAPNRVKRIDNEATVLDELSQDGYLFFYELHRTCKTNHNIVSFDDVDTTSGNNFIKCISGIKA